jgi:ribosomal protein S11/predicted transcriptional regulator
METIATTFRLKSELQAALQSLSKLRKRPMNILVNEAVKTYLDQNLPNVENELEGVLAKLRAYRKSDPDFEKAIDAFAEAEVTEKDDIDDQAVIEEGVVTQKRPGRGRISNITAIISSQGKTIKVSMQDEKGKVLVHSSATPMPSDDPKKLTFYRRLLGEPSQKVLAQGLRDIAVHIQGSEVIRNPAVRALEKAGLHVTSVEVAGAPGASKRKPYA